MNNSQSDNLSTISIISHNEYNDIYSKLLSIGMSSNMAKGMALLVIRSWHDEEFATILEETFNRGDYIKIQKMMDSELKDNVMIERMHHHNFFIRIWNKFKELFS